MMKMNIAQTNKNILLMIVVALDLSIDVLDEEKKERFPRLSHVHV